MTEQDKLPRAGAIMYSFGWNNINLPSDSYDDMIEMMHEYCKQVIDVIADGAKTKRAPAGLSTQFVVDKESILKFKELLK